MSDDSFRLPVEGGAELFVYRFEPEARPRAVVQIAHGMAEHAGRYARFARALNAAGYAVYANDHRGHGKSVASAADLGFFAESDGFLRLVADMHALRRRIESDHAGLPVFLFGHSMGSLLSQEYLFTHGRELRGAVLSGTSGGAAALARAGVLVAKLERWRLGRRGRSALLQRLSFGDYNRKFAPTRTEFDWLSRDTSEVDKYAADPACGFRVTVQAWIDVLEGVVRIADEARIRTVPKDLPIHLVSGALDPVGANGRGVQWLADAYRRAGVREVTVRLYEEARHELLNELNRDAVERDLVAWFDGVLASTTTGP